MRGAINKVLDQLDLIFTPDALAVDPAQLQALRGSLQQVQDAYVELILQALTLLTENRLAESHDLLQTERDQLETTLTRIGTLIEQAAELGQPQLQLVIEYLFTRARLVDELKMFPAISLELLERLSLDESLEETINHLETVMTGKRNLYQMTMSSLAS